MVQINATTQDRDLGAVAKDIRQIIADTTDQVPKGATVALLGQVKTMDSAFSGLLYGLLGAIVLIYLLIVVNFQSWSDPFVIITDFACSAGRYCLDAVCHLYAIICAGLNRRHYVHGRCNGQIVS